MISDRNTCCPRGYSLSGGIARGVLSFAELLADFLEHFRHGGFKLLVFAAEHRCRVVVHFYVRLDLVVLHEAPVGD